MLERKPQWPLQRHVWDQEALMDRVMARLGIEPLVAVRSNQGRDIIAARDRCVACQSNRNCARWLDAAVVLSAAPVFCPNAQIFAAWRDKIRADAAAP